MSCREVSAHVAAGKRVRGDLKKGVVRRLVVSSIAWLGPFGKLTLWNRKPLISAKCVIIVVIDRVRTTSDNRLEDSGYRNSANVTNLNVRNNPAGPTASLSLCILNKLPRKVFSANTEQNGWSVTEKHRLPFHLTQGIKYLLGRWRLEVEK